MIHDPEIIDSLIEYVKKHAGDGLPYDKLYNEWARETGTEIHDADTAEYCLKLIPKIERSLYA